MIETLIGMDFENAKRYLSENGRVFRYEMTTDRKMKSFDAVVVVRAKEEEGVILLTLAEFLLKPNEGEQK